MSDPSQRPLNTDDRDSDFNSTPNSTPSESRARASSPLPSPLPSPLRQWEYLHRPLDRNSPTTPPPFGAKRTMEHAYTDRRQGEMDAPRAPSFSPITLPADAPQSVEIDNVESVNAQHNQQAQEQHMAFLRAQPYSPHTMPRSSPQIRQSSTPVSESAAFPTDLPSPSVPFRLEPHSPVLDRLTAQYIAQGPHPQIPHVGHAAIDQKLASDILSKHQVDRIPFVGAASRRLQAVVGVRNDLTFDLLMGTGAHDASNLVVGRNGALVDLGLRNMGRGEEEVMSGNGGGGANWEDFPSGRGNDVTSGEAVGGEDQESMRMNMDMNTNTNADEAHSPNNTAQNLQAVHASFNTVRSPIDYPSHSYSSHHQQTIPQENTPNPTYEGPPMAPFFPPSVNPYTGEGLRNYLLTRASITGSTKRECRSISFHDFTPDVRTGEFRNQLLVHFGVDGISSSERVEVVELSLPDINGTLHPWLSIYIQRPLLTINTPSKTCPSTSTPPNFPKPTPTAWLCIAVPVANITSYPIQPDTSLPPSLLEPTSLADPLGVRTYKTAQRQDYDFSFQGVPIFEFSTRALFPPCESPIRHAAPVSDFLCSTVPHHYDPADAYRQFPAQVLRDPESLQRAARKYARAAGVREQELRTYGDMIADESGVDVSEELSPNEGIWWCQFYRGVTRDRIRWERVKRCMGRGRCRVVLRWQDVPEEMKGLGPRCTGAESGIGLGLSGRTSKTERVLQEMTREIMSAGKKRRGRKSLLASLANTTSGGGWGVWNPNVGNHTHSHSNSHTHLHMRSGSGSGEALRDSLRARAMSNRMGFNGGDTGI